MNKTGPKTVAFAITSKCEEKCSFCFRKKIKDTTLKEFQGKFEEILKVNPTLVKVVITGGNPELNKDFWAICDFVKTKGVKLKAHSNYVNKNSWPRYLSCDELAIPIDSLHEQPFRSENAAKNFIEALKYFQGKTRVQVHTVVCKQNLKEMELIKGFLDSKGFFERNNWKIFRLVGAKKLKKLELSEEEWERVKDRFHERNVSFVDSVLDLELS